MNAKTFVSSVTSTNRGNRSAKIFTITPILAHASSKPSAPPATDNTIVSAKRCRTMAPRPAPNAVLMAISFRRDKVLASTRLATLAQAISRTKTTAPNNTSSAGRMSPTNCSRNGTTVAPHPLSSSGYCCSRRCEMLPSSALAWRISTPDLSRAMTM